MLAETELKKEVEESEEVDRGWAAEGLTDSDDNIVEID